MNPTSYFSLVKKSRLYSVLLLENFISAFTRNLILKLVGLAILIIVLTAVVSGWSTAISGLLLLVSAILLFLWSIELFFRSYYYESIITNEYVAADVFTFTVGRILFQAGRQSVLPAFLLSDTGQKILCRLGVPSKEVATFLSTHRDPEALPLTVAPGEVITMRTLVSWLWLAHESFQTWLLYFDIKQEDLLAATAWVVREIETTARRERWWSKENLDRVPALAGDWSYGGTYKLEEYSQDLTASVERTGSSGELLRSKEVTDLETVLLRGHEANALLVGPAGESSLSVLWQFARFISNGTTVPAFRSKRILLLSVAKFLADLSKREDFERGLIKICNEAVLAGNVILAIDNLAALIQGGEGLGSDPIALLDQYLASDQVQLIGLVDVDTFHRVLEPRTALLNRFEKINVPEINDDRIITLLEDQARELEKKYPVTITYPALSEIVLSAGQYFQADSLSDKAMDLLIEAVPWVLGHGRSVVDRRVIQDLTKNKTNIPVGTIGEAEKQKLLGLEGVLQSRVIGQKAALTAVANAMRRGRTGIRNPKRPMGSFLFLGPTGVGKTETAKALAAVFFGREDALLRLDMSEYQTADALERLIGSFTTGQPGALSTMLRQNPYGVLLLDEFEKTNREVLNLFLQILDEGFFSDMLGKRINARNIIFVATSNAGAELIWQMVGKGTDPSLAKDEIVNEIVSKGIYRPELLNRFDDVIVFHPLNQDELMQVARLMLERLAVRLKGQAIILTVTDGLVKKVVAEGSNQLFGARPMQRYIQDRVEQLIAEAMIKGEIKSGSQISFGDNLNLAVN